MLTGSSIDCEFIENVDDPTHFCNKMKNTSFSTEGFTAGSACCICGGGTKLTQNNEDRQGEIDPKLMDTLEEGNYGAEKKFIDFIYRMGLGESEGEVSCFGPSSSYFILPPHLYLFKFSLCIQGIPNLEFLGR